MIGDIKDFTRGYRFASNHFDDENDKQKAIDYLYIVSDSEDYTNFDRGIKEFLSFNKLTSYYEPCFGVYYEIFNCDFYRVSYWCCNNTLFRWSSLGLCFLFRYYCYVFLCNYSDNYSRIIKEKR